MKPEMTVRELSEYLRVSIGNLKRIILSGKLKATKKIIKYSRTACNTYVITSEDLQAYLNVYNQE